MEEESVAAVIRIRTEVQESALEKANRSLLLPQQGKIKRAGLLGVSGF